MTRALAPVRGVVAKLRGRGVELKSPGELDAMLLKIADNYDEEVDVAVASLVSLLEPMMVVVIGGIVGTIVVSMFLPMVAMIESLQGGNAV